MRKMNFKKRWNKFGFFVAESEASMVWAVFCSFPLRNSIAAIDFKTVS
jgi:hypothetical protein